MKKLNARSISVAFCFCLFLSVTDTKGQKLPNTQTVSLEAPPELRIDGKSSEWESGYQAFNRQTELFYTLSNDKKNIYLAVRSLNSAITSKLLCGGLTFIVSPKAANASPIRITYPVPASDGMRQLLVLAINYPNKTPGMEYAYARDFQESDSLLHRKNKEILAQSKDIYISGIPSVTDSLVSVYNDIGIKVRAALEDKEKYICEIAIPIKYLGITKDDPSIQYSIRLNAPELHVLRNRVAFENYVIGRGQKKRDLRELGGTTHFTSSYSLAGLK